MNKRNPHAIKTGPKMHLILLKRFKKIMIDNYNLLKAMNLVKILFKNLYG